MKTVAFLMIATAAIGITSCATAPAPAVQQDQFFANLTALCGKRFEGKIVTTDAADADFAASRLLMHVRDCSAQEIRIPFWVGDDRSRTWVISRNLVGLTLKHDHRDLDGNPVGLHWYGGDTTAPGSARRQEFPVDDFSTALFNAGDASVSTTNVWAVEVEPGDRYVYELSRPNRLLRVSFDLTKPISE